MIFLNCLYNFAWKMPNIQVIKVRHILILFQKNCPTINFVLEWNLQDWLVKLTLQLVIICRERNKDTNSKNIHTVPFVWGIKNKWFLNPTTKSALSLRKQAADSDSSRFISVIKIRNSSHILIIPLELGNREIPFVLNLKQKNSGN